MARDPWAEFEEVAPAQSGGPRPIYTAPNPQREIENARDARGEQRDEIKLGIDQRSEGRTEVSSALSNIGSLRSAYESNQQVKDYRAAFPILMDALQAPPNATGDNALIYAYAKAMDPGSVVRESEMGMVQSGASTVESAAARLKKEFGLEGGGQLPPEVRKRLKFQINQRVGQYAQAYDNQRARYAADAQAFGIDPERVIGPHDASPFVPRYVELVKQLNGDDAVKAPTNADIAPNGVRFGMDGDPGGLFSPAKYLEERYGLSSTQQDRILGMWRANLGNPNLSVEAVKQWYAQEGVPPPSDADIQKTIEQAREGGAGSPVGFDTAKAEQDYLAKLDAALAARGSDPESMSGAIGAKAAQGAMWGAADEVAGIGGALGALLRGGDPVGGYEAERDVIRREQERAYDAHPVAGTIAELGGGLVTGGIGMRPAATIGDAAATAAKQGAVAGYNYGEGAGGSALGAGLGATIGAGAGAGGFKIGERLAARAAARPPSSGSEVMEAANRVNANTGSNIIPLPADVGGAATRRATAGAAQSTFGSAAIIEGAQAVNREAGNAVSTLAGREGQILSRQGAGEQALAGADKAIRQSGTKVDALYAKARRLAGDARVQMPNARTVLEKHISELSDTPGGTSGLERLRNLANDISGDWPVDGIKRMRKELRDEFIKDGLRGSDLERRVNEVVDAADFDIEQGLTQLGKPEAAAAYSAASQAASERFTLIDEVLQPILGRKGDKSGEEAFDAINRLTRGDAVTLGKFMKALPAEEAGAVRASIVNRLGRASKGQQGADGETFSLSTFLTNWNDEGISREAKAALFGGELREALNDVARVAQGSKEAARYSNHSNTAGAHAFAWIVNGAPFAGGALLSPGAAIAGAGASIAAQAISGRILAAPAFARWLAKLPRQNSAGAVRSHIERLQRIAANDPVIATEALGLQKQLLQAFQGPTRAAANEQTSTKEGGTR